ncbi:MAG: LPS assembly protein LptD [Rhodanobacter sp.]|jgi:LPS-assembly protein|nr:LPS assembly protein LptD [Rhodanobacter sp.]
MLAILLLALPAAAVHTPTGTHAEPGCPVGIIHCQKKHVEWEMCKKNDQLDFYVSGLPQEGDRRAAPRNVDALKVNRSGNNLYTLEGQAELKQLDLLLHADRITYDAETTDYSAEGYVTYQDRGMLMSSSHVKGNVDLNQCTLDGVRYQLLSSRGNGTAEVVVMEDVGRIHLTNATYSTCDVDRQSWAFSAREMELDQSKGIARGKDVTFRVHEVPVFWFPRVRWSLDDRRLSGFLTPMVSATTRRGLDVTFPYYFNLAPNYDATLYPRIMTERGAMLGGEFRYLTDSSKGMLNFDVIGHDAGAASEETKYAVPLPNTRWWYRFQDTTSFNSTWSAAVDINRVSDKLYFDDFGRGLYAAMSSFLPSSAYIYGHGTWWNASFGGDANQITDPILTKSSEPYRRLPRATFNAEHSVLGDLSVGINSEFTEFDKYQSLTGQRVDLFPYLAYPIETAAYFVRPQLGYRYTAYDLRNLQYATPDSINSGVTGNHPTRGVPIFNVDAGLIFERNLNFRNEGWTQTLEPRLYYLRVPYRNQNDLPIFDTMQVPFTFGELFRTNGFVGADRQMDANNLSLALTTRFLQDSTGVERLSASIGQIRYLDGQQRVQLLPNVAPTLYSGSAYAGELDLHLNDRWRFVLEEQWNPNTHKTDLSTVSVENRFGSNGIVNVSYRYRRDFEDQIDVSAAIPLTPSWRLLARENYALSNPLASPLNRHGTGAASLDQFVGIEHEGCCTASRLIVRRWVHDLQGNYDTAVYFEVVIKGVGPVGQNTDAFLRRGILGYQ